MLIIINDEICIVQISEFLINLKIISQKQLSDPMSHTHQQHYVTVQRGSVQVVSWSFSSKSSNKPELIGYKHPKLESCCVRIKVLYFGIGHQDVKAVKQNTGFLIPGTQVVGIIEAVGQDVGMRKVGEVVGVAYLKKCQKHPHAGGFGTHIQVHAEWAIPLPRNIPIGLAAPLFSSGVTAYNVVSHQAKRVQLEYNRKPRLCVVGLGAVGLMVVKWAHHFNTQITVFSHTAQKQNQLKELKLQGNGFFLQTEQNFKKHAYKFDVVIVAGDISKAEIGSSLVMARKGGKVVLVPTLTGEVGISGFELVVNQKEITGIKGGSKTEYYNMLQTIAHNTTQTNKSLLPVVQTYNFLDFETAFTNASNSSNKGRGVVKVDDNIVERFNKKQI